MLSETLSSCCELKYFVKLSIYQFLSFNYVYMNQNNITVYMLIILQLSQVFMSVKLRMAPKQQSLYHNQHKSGTFLHKRWHSYSSSILQHSTLNLGTFGKKYRKLQFEYSKVRDQNQQLRHRLHELEILYEDTIRQLMEMKKYHSRSIAEINDKIRGQSYQRDSINKEMKEILDSVYQLKGQSCKLNHQSSLRDLVQVLHFQIQHISKEFNKAKRSVKQMMDQASQKQKQWTQREDNFFDQIAQLQSDLKSLQKIQMDLKIQNEKMVRQNEELISQIKSYKTIAIQARNQRTPLKIQPVQIQTDINQDDKDFAADLLSYQKQLLSRVFGLVIQSFHNNDIEICLRKIYEAYEEVTEIFRQKLQIEYDLSDLQCQYKKLKGTAPKDSLIQLRKEINNFRKQLFNQKELLQKREDILQQRIKDLSGQSVNDNRLKNFTIDLQKKLRKQKSGISENQNESQAQVPKSGSIQFRHTLNTDELVKKMIQNDRQKLQKMLKQTRSMFRK